MSTGSQQATKATLNIPTMADVKVSVKIIKVLSRPIFSIGHSNVTSP